MAIDQGAWYPAEWFKKGGEDLARVGRRLREGDTEDAAFHLQQALEKYLKGFLLSKGWSLKKIHDLEALLDDAVTHAPALERYRPLVQQVTGYYLLERYPSVEAAPTRSEVTSAYRKAQALVRRLGTPCA
ncbi:MAG: HEPN domain-containing protein [Candidatus Omnitrophica bacterium]|nr:HEPN domain-containing protein [Candidatus Omnitrophota bacterium]